MVHSVQTLPVHYYTRGNTSLVPYCGWCNVAVLNVRPIAIRLLTLFNNCSEMIGNFAFNCLNQYSCNVFGTLFITSMTFDSEYIYFIIGCL